MVNVTHTVIAIPAGRLADRIGKEKVLTLGARADMHSSESLNFTVYEAFDDFMSEEFFISVSVFRCGPSMPDSTNHKYSSELDLIIN